jgi:predicted NBD/HSP70 family sugar kinase
VLRRVSTLVKQSQATVRQNNLRLLLSTILRYEPLSRADLGRLTHMSKPTVSSLINDLRARGLISEIGTGPSRSGRKPILLRFESDQRRLLAFEMGRVGFRVALADLKGRLLRLEEGVFPPDGGTAGDRDALRLKLLGESILRLLEATSTRRERLLKAICIAPGVYVQPGKPLRWVPAGGAEGSTEVPDPTGYFRELLGCDVLLYHSTKAALLGERVAGKARGCSSAVYVDFAFGLGCAIMIDGAVYGGPGESAGEIGYFYSSPDEFRSRTVRPFELGALEQNISGKALADRARAAIREHPEGILAELVGRDGGEATARHVFAAYRYGDTAAATMLEEAFLHFNMALCNVINLLAPETVIFGGGFAGSGDTLLALIAPAIRDRVLIPPRLEVSELRSRACLIGGVQHLIDNTDFLSELIHRPEPSAAAPAAKGGTP